MCSKSIRFSDQADDRLSKVALKLKRTKRQVVTEMVDYFYRSRKDPSDLSDEMLKKDLSRGIDRIVSFIRTQEEQLLIPVHGMLQDTLKSMVGIKASLKTVDARQTDLVKIVLEQGKILVNQDLQLKAMFEGLAKKERLKSDFRRIMEDYFVAREALGWPASQAKKEELVRIVRQALEKL